MIHKVPLHGHTAAAQGLVDQINDAILFPLIALLMGAAVVVFIWGGFEYLQGAADPGARKQGQQHMLWGIIGFVVMVAAYAILSLVVNTFFGTGVMPAP